MQCRESVARPRVARFAAVTADDGRHIGLIGATGIGVGAIVGGGILALAGIAFASTGPAAIVAFGLNGVIALLTVASFAELGARFPESGGTYTYAKKVLSIESAFLVGWVVWFASILAGVLYALGFAAFAAEGLDHALTTQGADVGWIRGAGPRLALALAATAFYALALVRRAVGAGYGSTIGKLVVFVVLIAGGVWAWVGADAGTRTGRLVPFFSAGPLGLVQAMGYTFIALQGFDLIAAVGGEVREPERNLRRSMYAALALALAIYLPLLFLIATVGAPADVPIADAAATDPAGFMAEAVGRFMGPAGFWLVIGAGMLAMLSALQANLLGSSRVAYAMARDRTLPRSLGRLRRRAGTPAVAVATTAAMIAVLAALVGDVSDAGAASSLIFLVSFAFVHWAAILVRRRSGDQRPPVVPALGGALCLALAVFQAFAVLEAGIVVALWLAVGATFYFVLLAPGARLADVTALARDPMLARYRGRSPLVLVPIANPASAAGLVDVAATVRTPGAGRILLLSVVRPPGPEIGGGAEGLLDAQRLLGEALERSLETGLVAEALFTIAGDTWREIARVARLHRCETVLMGFPSLALPEVEARLEAVIGAVDAEVVIVRAPYRWRIADARRVLIPLGPRRDHSRLRARLLASLTRADGRSLTFLHSVPPGTSAAARRREERDVRAVADDEAAGAFEVHIEEAVEPTEGIFRHARDADVIVMGVDRGPRGRHALGHIALAVARESETPVVLIVRRGTRA
jgi:basic amino acid/polyamine antiporter, APA family